MTKIAMYNVSPVEVPYIDDWAKKNDVEVKTTDKPLTSENVDLAAGCSSISLKPLGPIAEEIVYQKLHEYGVKCIGLRIVGFNTINFDFTKKYDLLVTNVPVYSPRAIAEMTVTQAMYLLRKIGEFRYRMDHDHDFTWPSNLISNEIYNLTVGLIGVGHIGSAVAQIFSAMGAKVIAYDVAYNPEFEPFLTYTDFDTVLKEADIVSLHTPLFPSTENMIGEKQLKEMKKSAYLINCARGELVDTELDQGLAGRRNRRCRPGHLGWGIQLLWSHGPYGQRNPRRLQDPGQDAKRRHHSALSLLHGNFHPQHGADLPERPIDHCQGRPAKNHRQAVKFSYNAKKTVRSSF